MIWLIWLLLPDMAEEYSKVYPSHLEGKMNIKVGLNLVQEMVNENVQCLLQDDYSQESLLKRWRC